MKKKNENRRRNDAGDLAEVAEDENTVKAAGAGIPTGTEDDDDEPRSTSAIDQNHGRGGDGEADNSCTSGAIRVTDVPWFGLERGIVLGVHVY